MATRLPGEPSSAPHKKIYAESKVEQKSFLKKVFSQKNPNLRSLKYPICTFTSMVCFFRFEKKNVEIIDFILAYQLGVPGVQSEMLPQTLIYGLFSSRDFPAKRYVRILETSEIN